jgi:NAD(P)-dependent dehydrogenase (short-subunit alcohol dehydrogenase family)
VGENMIFSFENRVVLITGGSGSFGKAIAEKLHSQGASIILLGRSQEKLNKSIEAFTSNGERYSSYACDITDELSLIKVNEDILKLYKKIDVLITCAAAPAISGKLEDTSLDDWRSMLAIDLDGVFLSCKIFGRSMINEKYGRIINFTSFHDVATYPYRTVYNAAKSGVQGLSRALAVEWGHYGITVNTVAPGPILTPRTKWFLSQDANNEAGMLARTPNGRLGDMSDISNLITFLASEESKHINGQEILIDGGWTKNAWWGSHTDL